MTEPKYRITQFEKALHDRSAFSCGVTPIDNWIKTSISEETKSDRVRLWCGTDPDGVLFGAYALNPHGIDPNKAGPLGRRKERKPIPALYLSCLAIDSRFQKQGLGEALMGHAIEKAVQLSKDIPICAMVLDVYSDENFDRRLAFYARLGFSSFDPEDPARMYLTMADARIAVEAQEKQAAAASS